MEELKYVIEDKTIAELLGVQNFSTDEAAVLELVKNAYDAQAINLRIIFSHDTLSIIDNGVGMDEKDIKKYWMHIGISSKAYEITDANNNIRVQAGSKGVGRFALARLGYKVEIQSKKEKQKGIIWKTDWNKSTLEFDNNALNIGTTIVITGLREKWGTRRINSLVKYLERTYNDTSMKIEVCNDEACTLVPRHFPDPVAGVNCKSYILLKYVNGILSTTVYSDEFSDEARNYCTNTDLHYYSVDTNMEDELKNMDLPEIDNDLLGDQLSRIGDFSAVFFFNLTTSKFDNDKFLYKRINTPQAVEEGVILYRNAFSISSFDGKKDWLGLGKRSRKSPAAASHPTGAWRVRENQIAGYVLIDKEENAVLKDLSNRQGLDENIHFKLFVEIILTGIKEFERYRQGIIRDINKKNAFEDEKPAPIVEKFIKSPLSIKMLSDNDLVKLRDEVVVIQATEKQSKKTIEEIEARYKYDIRILNVLATTGLKTSTIAHEFTNERNIINEIYDSIIVALKEYNLWEMLNDSDHTEQSYRNIPHLLQRNAEIANKVVSFMDNMLAEIEKKQFEVKEQNILEILETIKRVWQKDYRALRIDIDIDPFLEFNLSEDILHVIFDNLILNSVQQNENNTNLHIRIAIKEFSGALFIEYSDNGKGLDKKYKNNPKKILEVHETTRLNGHGLGMWIINNTVEMSGGEVIDILGDAGFSIKLSIGGKNVYQ